MKYGFIGRHAGRYRVTMRCRVLGVQRSAYYAWRGPPGTVIEPQELALRGRMKALFAASRGSLGSCMLMHNLNQEGFQIGRERRRGLMQTLNLKLRHKRKYKVTTDSKHRLPVAQHGLNRAFCPSSNKWDRCLVLLRECFCSSFSYYAGRTLIVQTAFRDGL